MKARPDYGSVVFAGGGCRCVWQVGFWENAAPEIGLRPRRIGAVSAGSAMAAMLVAGVVEESMRDFTRRVALNERNVYPANLLNGQPVFPHERIYRATILEHLDSDAMRRLHAGPDIRVLLTRMPPWLGVFPAMTLAFFAYQLEQMLPPHVHTVLGRKAGFRAEVVSMRECRTPEEVADLILHSSCMPPFTPRFLRRGRPVLDGGLFDGVPVDAVDEGDGPTLVLLTKHYPHGVIPRVPGRTYVQPSEPISIYKWDYTDPKGVQATYDLGRRDGERFARTMYALAS